NARPDLPPLAIVRPWRKSSLPLSGLASPWHSKQYAFKIGRTCDSNVGVTGSAASAPVTKQQPSVIGRRVRMSKQSGGNEVRRLILLWAENAHEAIGKNQKGPGAWRMNLLVTTGHLGDPFFSGFCQGAVGIRPRPEVVEPALSLLCPAIRGVGEQREVGVGFCRLLGLALANLARRGWLRRIPCLEGVAQLVEQ